MNLPNKPNLNRPIDVSYYWDWFTNKKKIHIIRKME